MAKKTTDPTAAREKSAADVLYDDAIEAAGLDPRDDGEAYEAHGDRIAKGPNTRQQLAAVADNATHLRFGETMRAAQSAREYHSDPNPADTHPRGR